MKFGLQLGLQTCPITSTGLSNDTSLSEFTIDSEDVLELSNIQRGNGVTEVPVTAVPTHPGATRTINGIGIFDPVTVELSTGDNVVTVTVTAEDGVTTQDHVVTVRRLTAGVQEITVVDVAGLTGLTGADFATFSTGKYLELYQDAGLVRFWFNTGTESAPATPCVEVTITDSYSSNEIAAAFATAVDMASVDAGAGWSTSTLDSVVTITDSAAGVRTDADPVTTGFVINVTQQGQDPT